MVILPVAYFFIQHKSLLHRFLHLLQHPHVMFFTQMLPEQLDPRGCVVSVFGGFQDLIRLKSCVTCSDAIADLGLETSPGPLQLELICELVIEKAGFKSYLPLLTAFLLKNKDLLSQIVFPDAVLHLFWAAYCDGWQLKEFDTSYMKAPEKDGSSAPCSPTPSLQALPVLNSALSLMSLMFQIPLSSMTFLTPFPEAPAIRVHSWKHTRTLFHYFLSQPVVPSTHVCILYTMGHFFSDSCNYSLTYFYLVNNKGKEAS